MVKTNRRITHADIKIDKDLESLLPPLSEYEFKALEDSILADGLQDALKVWINPEDGRCYLVDGHNRYTIMDKYGKEIPQNKIAVLEIERTKDDVIFYMLQYQLGRRNLTEGQRVAYVLRYENYFNQKAKQNQSVGGGDKKSVSPNLGKAIPEEEKIDTNAELAKMAGMSKEKFRQGKVVLKSDNVEVKEKYKRDEISTYKAYREVTGKDKDIKQSHPKSELKTVADYDKEIANIEAEIAALYEMKTQLIKDRHKAFQADNTELRCEYESQKYIDGMAFCFYLMKGEEKLELFRIFSFNLKGSLEELYRHIDLNITTLLDWDEGKPNLSDEEKRIITDAIICSRNQILDEIKQWEESVKNYSKQQGNGSKPNLSDNQKALLKPILKKLSLEYHPDTNQNKNATEIMQTINQLREVIGL